MAKTGWCLDGHHFGGTYEFSQPCPSLYCDCKCHPDWKDRALTPWPTDGNVVLTKPKRRRRKA